MYSTYISWSGFFPMV